MLNATFTAPDLDTFSQLDRLGLTVTGQLIEPHRSVLECRVLEPDNWCHGCGQQG
ncbi:ISL3 family transposase, partial [Brachybacterium paraconglomeratum]